MTHSPAQQYKNRFTNFPFVLICASFATGILVARNSEIRWGIFLALALASAVSAFVVRKQFVSLCLLLSSFLMLGGFCFRSEELSVATNRLKILFDSGVLRSGNEFFIEGIVSAKPEELPGGYFLSVWTESLSISEQKREVSGLIRLFVPTEISNSEQYFQNLKLNSGDRVALRTQLRRDERFQNPGVVSAKTILDQKNIDANGTVKDVAFITKISEGNFSPIGWVYDQRQNLIDEFRRRFEMRTAGVLSASLLGNHQFIDKPTGEGFREGGTFHVLVISGMQITIIGTLAFFLFRAFVRKKLIVFLATNVFLWLYVVAVGADPPVVRAGLMFSLLHLSTHLNRENTNLNSLGATLFLLLVWQPSDLFNQSFQLTSICVLAIVGMAVPLIEKMRAIGSWQPRTETPIPPRSSRILKPFCEMLYWSERAWKLEQSLTVWSCNLTKTKWASALEEKGLQKIFRYTFESIIVSTVVQFWMFPLMIMFFHRVSIAALFLNIWVGILIAIESLVALAAISIAQLSETMALPLIRLTELLNTLLIHIGDPLIESGWASFRIPHYSGSGFAIYFAYFVPLVVLLILVQIWKPLALRTSINIMKPALFSAVSVLFVVAAVLLLHPYSQPSPDGRLRVDFLDVGQGDSAFVTFPDGKTLLIDGGGRIEFDTPTYSREGEVTQKFQPDVRGIGEDVVSAFLWERGYDSLDYILPTHADADHIQGLSDVARNFRVGATMLARRADGEVEYRRFEDSLRRRKTPGVVIGGGDILEIGGAKLEILAPERSDYSTSKWRNNDSVVLRLTFGARAFLFTGDIENDAEESLIRSETNLRSDVVKVAHHGSKTSSIDSFVSATQANYAIITVGKNSPFGHPKEEVVTRWKNSGAEVLTTGENGTISFSTDGNDLQIETFVKEKVVR